MAGVSQQSKLSRLHLGKGARARQFMSEELEFFAENTEVTIVPTFTAPMLHFIAGDLGPFHANLATAVPLWLAVRLKEQHRCRIECPEWMQVDSLRTTLDEETQNGFLSNSLPFHYMEIAHLIFNRAADNIPDADLVRTLLADIQNIREEKINAGAAQVFSEAQSGEVPGAKMNGVSHMEINKIRRPFTTALNNVWNLRHSNRLSNRRANRVQSSGGASSSRDMRAQQLHRVAMLRRRRQQEQSGAGEDENESSLSNAQGSPNEAAEGFTTGGRLGEGPDAPSPGTVADEPPRGAAAAAAGEQHVDALDEDIHEGDNSNSGERRNPQTGALHPRLRRHR